MFLKYLSPSEKTAFLELAHFGAWVDGTLANEERDLLLVYREELGLDEMAYDIQRPEMTLGDILQAFRSPIGRRIAFIELIGLVLADGLVSPAEGQLLDEVQRAFEFDDVMRQRFEGWVHRLIDVYSEGRALLDVEAAVPLT